MHQLVVALATPAGVKPLMAIWSPFLISAAASAAVIRGYIMIYYLTIYNFTISGAKVQNINEK